MEPEYIRSSDSHSVDISIDGSHSMSCADDIYIGFVVESIFLIVRVSLSPGVVIDRFITPLEAFTRYVLPAVMDPLDEIACPGFVPGSP